MEDRRAELLKQKKNSLFFGVAFILLSPLLCWGYSLWDPMPSGQFWGLTGLLMIVWGTVTLFAQIMFAKKLKELKGAQ